jgi:hypothetical protein
MDNRLSDDGMVVLYRDSQYRKTVSIKISCSNTAVNGKLVGKWNQVLMEYFNSCYTICDFTLSGVTMTADIDVGSSEKVGTYMNLFKKVGRVKGFLPVMNDRVNEATSFCLEGNSNGIGFYIYDLGNNEGILRTEIQLKKPKAIRLYTDKYEIGEQMIDLADKSSENFRDIFLKIIPPGNYYKKEQAVEIICKNVKKSIIKRRMLRLIDLIPEKKSIYLAKKEMNYRSMDRVMEAFAEINLSPITIGRRWGDECLEGVYGMLNV